MADQRLSPLKEGILEESTTSTTIDLHISYTRFFEEVFSVYLGESLPTLLGGQEGDWFESNKGFSWQLELYHRIYYLPTTLKSF